MLAVVLVQDIAVASEDLRHTVVVALDTDPAHLGIAAEVEARHIAVAVANADKAVVVVVA